MAEAVGVSPATVSNAYNRPGQLSVELRERILATADELGYAGPDPAGRALRSGRAGSIGVLFTEHLSYAFSDPYAVGFLTGLSQVVERQGTSIVLLPVTMNGSDPDVTAVSRATIDAVTTFSVSSTHPAALLVTARGIPLVSTDLSDDPDAAWVAIDDRRAGALLGSHLGELGHRRICVIVDTNLPAGSEARLVPSDDQVSCVVCRTRLRGLRDSLPEADILLVSGGHNAFSSGKSAAAFGLDHQPGCTALVGISDVVALGALETLHDRGLVPGRDVSVCGVDDIPAAESAGLTTIRQPIVEKGRRVGELLLDPTIAERQVLLPIELVVRSSTGPALSRPSTPGRHGREQRRRRQPVSQQDGDVDAL
nr:LacI family DNA-binding transcriptional regulator [Microlunatus panaciterrae]